MDEVLIVLGWGMGLGGLWLVGRWLWGDRSRGRRRCRGCWYDLDAGGGVPVRCPECGREHAVERALLRTRRRWRWVAVGVVLALAGVVVGMTPAYRAGRVYRFAPSWLLAELVPLYPPVGAGGTANQPGLELIDRLMSTSGDTHPAAVQLVGPRRISNGEIAAVIRRMAEGNMVAPAGSERWVESTGSWLTGQIARFKPGEDLQYPDGTPADAALREAFEKLGRVMPGWHPMTREAWVSGLPVRIETGFTPPRWLGFAGRPRESAEWRVRGSGESGRVDGYRGTFQIPAVGVPGEGVVIDLTLRLHRGSGKTGGAELLREQSFVLGWKVSASVEDVVEVVDSPLMQRAMVEVFVAKHASDMDGFVEEGIWLAPEMSGVGFGVKVEIFDGEEYLGETHHWWMTENGRWVDRTVGDMRFVDLEEFSSRRNRALAAGTLRVRVSGVPELGLELLGAEKVWGGSVDVLVSDAQTLAETSDLGEVED